MRSETVTTGKPNVRKRRCGRRGAAIVEFALVALLLITLVFGIAEFGFMFSNALTVSSAAQQGARAAALVKAGTGGASGKILNAVYNASENLREPKDFQIIPADQVPNDDTTMGVFTQSRGPDDADWSAWDPDSDAPRGGANSQVRVTVRYRYKYLVAGLIFHKEARILQSSVVMRYGY